MACIPIIWVPFGTTVPSDPYCQDTRGAPNRCARIRHGAGQRLFQRFPAPWTQPSGRPRATSAYSCIRAGQCCTAEKGQRLIKRKIEFSVYGPIQPTGRCRSRMRNPCISFAFGEGRARCVGCHDRIDSCRSLFSLCGNSVQHRIVLHDACSRDPKQPAYQLAGWWQCVLAPDVLHRPSAPQR